MPWEKFGFVEPRVAVHAVFGGTGSRSARARVTDIRDQCLRAKVPFFFKQWGGVQKKKAGRVLDGRTWDEMPFNLARA
ncbi:MAG: DUF5131 family protein [Chloroflexi bacterium]|nr:DUF5131 family protein [Chloroflexota bacterium]